MSYAEQLRADVEEKQALKAAQRQAQLQAERADEQRIAAEQAVLASDKQAEIEATRARQRQVEERDARSLAQHNARAAAQPDREEQVSARRARAKRGEASTSEAKRECEGGATLVEFFCGGSGSQ
ncbi:hypothetical protein TeGR_g1693 [Tetraparma gracilis]|uniref:Uncharacterized protein n=1 Tax=Tetraparma gracilis TaxID=2962635 RepID=A0ABQ6N6Q9_9STRA|nr:hypothetical protein TeGR_g1693 [Tetraparma gracilis]